MQEQLNCVADELEEALTPEGTTADEAKQAALSGNFMLWWNLVTALRSGDGAAIGKAIMALLASLFETSAPPTTPDPGVSDGGGLVIGFQVHKENALGSRINWARLIEILQKAMPLIIGLLG